MWLTFNFINLHSVVFTYGMHIVNSCILHTLKIHSKLPPLSSCFYWHGLEDSPIFQIKAVKVKKLVIGLYSLDGLIIWLFSCLLKLRFFYANKVITIFWQKIGQFYSIFSMTHSLISGLQNLAPFSFSYLHIHLPKTNTFQLNGWETSYSYIT